MWRFTNFWPGTDWRPSNGTNLNRRRRPIASSSSRRAVAPTALVAASLACRGELRDRDWIANARKKETDESADRFQPRGPPPEELEGLAWTPIGAANALWAGDAAPDHGAGCARKPNAQRGCQLGHECWWLALRRISRQKEWRGNLQPWGAKRRSGCWLGEDDATTSVV